MIEFKIAVLYLIYNTVEEMTVKNCELMWAFFPYHGYFIIFKVQIDLHSVIFLTDFKEFVYS